MRIEYACSRKTPGYPREEDEKVVERRSIGLAPILTSDSHISGGTVAPTVPFSRLMTSYVLWTTLSPSRLTATPPLPSTIHPTMEHSPPPDSPILGKVVPPASVDYKDRELIFEHLFRKLAQFRNERLIYAVNEETETVSRQKSDVYDALLNAWCHVFVRNIWNACTLEGGELDDRQMHHQLTRCLPDPPKLAPLTETGTAGLPPLEEDKSLKKIINATLFLHLTTQKHYSALARAFTFSLGPNLRPAENAIAFTISNPDQALAEAEAKAKDEHAKQNQVFRKVGMGLGAAAGGLLIGVTGGLAAPLVGAGVGSILGFLGVGGTVAGVLATGLASSSVVCAALFGAYGAKSTREIVDRYTADVEDFRLIRMDRPQKGTDNLAVRICISGWLMAKDDVTEPWTIFNHGDRQEDTYALQWVRPSHTFHILC
jgi:hypothetical protein